MFTIKLVQFWYYFGSMLILFRYCVNTFLVLCQYYFGTMSNYFGRMSITISILFRYYVNTISVQRHVDLLSISTRLPLCQGLGFIEEDRLYWLKDFVRVGGNAGSLAAAA